MSSQYSWEERDSRDAVQEKCQKLMRQGINVKYHDTYDHKREFFIDFETDEEAVMFKLTNL